MHPPHFDTVHILGAPASTGFMVHAPLVQAPPMLVQSLQAPPPTPQVATDWPPTQSPLEQQPAHVLGSHLVFTSAAKAASPESKAMSHSASDATAESVGSVVEGSSLS
jgi:hypothetical protein